MPGRWIRTNHVSGKGGCRIHYDGLNRISLHNGPSVIHHDENDVCYSKEWYWKDKRHRKDGPALEYIDNGDILYAWYVRGQRIEDAATYQRRAKLSDEEMLALVLKYGDIG